MANSMRMPLPALWRGLGLAAVVALVTLPWWANPNVLFLAGLALTEALFALSWNLLFGYAGLANFGAAAFYAIGAYFMGAALRYGWPFPFLAALLGAALLGALTGLMAGLAFLRRLSGIHLAALTLALAELLRIAISRSELLGKDDGLSGVRRPAFDLLGVRIDLQSGPAYFGFLLVVCGLLAFLLWCLVKSDTGRVLRGIRQDPLRMSFIGVNVRAYRVAAFGLSGAFGAAAGALAAPWSQFVSLDGASWLHSAQPMLNTLLGGTGFFWGPAIGAFAYAVINFLTRSLTGLSEVVVGGALLVIVLLAPQGLAGFAVALAARLSRRSPAEQSVSARQAEPLAAPITRAADEG